MSMKDGIHNNLAGKKFGRLLAVERVPNITTKSGRKASAYRCICDCGKEKLIRSNSLTHPKHPIKSCGCLIGKKTKSFGEASFNHIYSRYSKTAKKRGLLFTLTKEQLSTLTKGNCKYCNKVPSSIEFPKQCNGPYIYNGIDRVDNSIGYTFENCVSCCKSCNFMKLNKTLDEFTEEIIRIYHHLIKPNLS